MTEHLPECWAKDPSDPPAWCICDELLACEQRVSEKFPAALSATSVQSMSIYGQGLREGFLSALDAAEAAVAELTVWQARGLLTGDLRPARVDLDDAVAAIRALKEKP